MSVSSGSSIGVFTKQFYNKTQSKDLLHPCCMAALSLAA